MFTLIEDFSEINEIRCILGSYASLSIAVDTITDDLNIASKSILEKINSIMSSIAFAEVEINALSDKYVKQLYEQSQELKHYKPFIDAIRSNKQHTLSTELEEFSSQISIVSNHAFSRFYEETLSRLMVKYNGEDITLTNAIHLLISNDSNAREAVAAPINEALKKITHPVTFVFNNIAKCRELDDNWRKYEKPRSYMNIINRIDDEVVSVLLNTVRSNYNKISHRYYKLKAEMMGMQEMHFSHRNAPLFEDDNLKFTWQEASKITQDTYSEFSPKMGEIATQFFSNKWIHAPIKKGKRGGAFCDYVATSKHPYVMVNYSNSMMDVSTLVHEVGHGIHSILAREHGSLMFDAPLTFAETASTFGEYLLANKLLEIAKTREEKLHILIWQLDHLMNLIIRQTSFSTFEEILHNKRRQKELTSDELCDMWIDTQKESLGSGIKYTDDYKYYWEYISHFVACPFYVYSYVFGGCFVNALQAIYKEKPEGFADKYIEMLSAGNTKTYKELMQIFDIDPINPNFWQKGMDEISILIDQTETLYREKKKKKKPNLSLIQISDPTKRTPTP